MILKSQRAKIWYLVRHLLIILTAKIVALAIIMAITSPVWLFPFYVYWHDGLLPALGMSMIIIMILLALRLTVRYMKK